MGFDRPASALARLRNRLARDANVQQPAGPERWVVLDTETSGLDSGRDRLLAIGAVAVRGTQAVAIDSFEAVIRQQTASSHDNIVIHGISGSAQRAGRAEAQVLREFEQWRAGAAILGWHIGFDLAFLRRAYAAHGIAGPGRDFLDLAPLAQSLFGATVNELDQWLRKFGIPVQARHSAAADAWMTALLTIRLVAAAASQGVAGFAALRRLAGNARWTVASYGEC
jgi:DNA polymerase III subunit epsilon